MKIIARHRWVSECIITESIDEKNDRIRRFTATICGWRNWKIYQGELKEGTTERIIKAIKNIRDSIKRDEIDNVLFSTREYFIKS